MLIKFKKPRRKVTKVFLHCTASDYPSHDIREIRKWHMDNNGWLDVGYHLLILFNGEIQNGRSLEKIPAAQRGHNINSIAICLQGGQAGKTSAFTNKQYDSLFEVCKEINEGYGGDITFHGHNEVDSSRACPLYNYKRILRLNDDGYMFGSSNYRPKDYAVSKNPKSFWRIIWEKFFA